MCAPSERLDGERSTKLSIVEQARAARRAWLFLCDEGLEPTKNEKIEKWVVFSFVSRHKMDKQQESSGKKKGKFEGKVVGNVE